MSTPTDASPVHLLETTLRDGSYEVDFQFTPEDTALIAGEVSRAGIRYIEVGHGMGVAGHLYAPHVAAPLAAESDSNYMRIARAVAGESKLGVLYVIGKDYGPTSYLDEIAAQGMAFVRLGLFPAEFPAAAFKHVERGKELGLTVSINLMQTYALPPSAVAQGGRELGRLGADWFYVVDSAGGMRADDVAQYVKAIREESGLTVGLHAHSNSGIAVANCLTAISAGATLVDSTFQGMGRGAGNPPTEQLLLALRALGHELGVDVDAIFRVGTFARTLLVEKGQDPLSFAAGSALLHTMNAKQALRAAHKRGKAPGTFLLEAGAEARRRGVFGEDDFEPTFETAAAKVPAAGHRDPPRSMVRVFVDGIGARETLELAAWLRFLMLRSKRTRKPSVLHAFSPSENTPSRPIPWSTADWVGVSLPVGEHPLTATGAPPPDFLVFDPDLEAVCSTIKPRQFAFRVPFASVLAEAAAELILAECLSTNRSLWVSGQALSLSERIRTFGVAVHVDKRPTDSCVIVLPACAGAPVDGIQKGDVVIALDFGSGLREIVHRYRSMGATVLSPSIGSAIGSLVTGWVRAKKAILKGSDRKVRGESAWVAWPHSPGPDDIVVDDINSPSCIVDTHRHTDERLLTDLAIERIAGLLAGRCGS